MLRTCVIVLALATASTAGAFAGISVAPPNFSTEEGVAFSGQITTFTDPTSSPEPFAVSVDWGDSTPLDTSATVAPVPSSSPPSFAVTGTHTYADEGSYTVAVTVTDRTSETGSNSSSIDVPDAPISLDPSPPAVNFTQNLPFSGPIVTFTDENPLATPSDFTVTIDWGDGSPTTPGIVTGGSGNFTVSGSHTYSETGPDPITVTVDDVDTGDSREVPTNVAPQIQLTNIVDTVYEGAPVGIIAHFTDANLTDQAADFQLCVNIGAGFKRLQIGAKLGNCDPTAFVVGGNGQFDVISLFAPALEEGDEVRIIVDVFNAVAGNGDSQFADVLDAPIAASPKAIQTLPNVAWSGNAGGFFDANQLATTADFTTVTIDWGDGSALDAGTAVRDGVGGYFAVMGTHTYTKASAMPYVVTVNVVDVGGQTVTVKSNAYVLATILDVAGVTNLVGAGVDTNLIAATFSLSDLTSLDTDFTATIDWGDGSSSAGTILGARGEFTVSGSHLYASIGTYATQITVTDTRSGGGVGSGAGASAVSGGSLTVNLPGSIQEIAGQAFSWTFEMDDATAGAAAAQFKIAIGWGDGSADTNATIAPRVGSAGVFDVTAGHTYAKAGTDMITVTVTDSSSAAVLATLHVTANVIDAPADGGGGTTGGTGSSGGCSAVGGNPSAPGLVILMMVAGALIVRRRRAI